MRNKVKIGDKVRRINCNWSNIKVGDIVTIKKFIGSLNLNIEIEEYSSPTFMVKNFEKVGITNPNSNIIVKE